MREQFVNHLLIEEILYRNYMVITDKLFKQGKIKVSTGFTERLPKTHALTILRQASVL